MTIEAVERALLQLAERLDQPFTPLGEPVAVAMALGHRARALYRGHRECFEAGRHVAGRALLRPMVETNIQLRFIREQPITRSILWQLESRRTWLGLAQEVYDRPLPREQQFAGLPTREELADWRRDLDEYRAQALAAGVEGVGRRGQLFPSVRRQVELLNTEEAWQAYVVAYMALGFEQHVGHGSFRDTVQYELEDGRLVHHEPETPRHAERLLVSSVFASTLVVVSSWLELGIEDAADRLRSQVVGR